jgi:transmembrane sensor
LATQGNTQVLKLNDGQLQYKESSEVSPSGGDLEGAFNTMSTPRGGQYQLTLSDGTKVWLNAASSLRYPATFTGKDRQVELNGEAYFEVAHNAAMPFKVNVAGKEEVEVLGTHFNINSYSDEPAVKTTLLEGSVKVTPAINTTISTQLATILKPGEQAQMQAGGKINRQTNVDIGKVMAWKNNIFNFNNENIMRQLSRWYNVDIRFEGTIPGIKFSGEIGRNLSLKQVLSILDETRIKYRIEGKTLVISS